MTVMKDIWTELELQHPECTPWPDQYFELLADGLETRLGTWVYVMRFKCNICGEQTIVERDDTRVTVPTDERSIIVRPQNPSKPSHLVDDEIKAMKEDG